MRPANPNSVTVDSFDCGDEWWEQEVSKTVHERKWDGNPLVTALEFWLEGKSVGFAFMVNKMSMAKSKSLGSGDRRNT